MSTHPRTDAAVKSRRLVSPPPSGDPVDQMHSYVVELCEHGLGSVADRALSIWRRGQYSHALAVAFTAALGE